MVNRGKQLLGGMKPGPRSLTYDQKYDLSQLGISKI